MYAFRTVNLSLIVALAFSITGCSGGNVGQVEGTITLDGQPVQYARVSFVPSDLSTGPAARCENTDENGVGPISRQSERLLCLVGLTFAKRSAPRIRLVPPPIRPL